MEGAARKHREVIVLDHQQVGVIGEQLAQLIGALGREAGAGGVLRAGGADDGSCALGDRGAQSVDGHPGVVACDRDRSIASQPDGVDAREKTGILQADGVVAGERLGEESLDGVGRAAGDREPRSGGARRVGHPRVGPRLQPGIDDRLAVEHGSPGGPGERAGRIGNARGIGVPGADVAQRTVGGEALLCDEAASGHARATSPAGDDQTGLGQVPVGGHNRVAVDAEVGRERPNGREDRTGRENTALDRGSHAVRDLARGRADDVSVHEVDPLVFDGRTRQCYRLA